MNKYGVPPVKPVNVRGVPLVIWVVIAGVFAIEYDVAVVPADHESEMLGFDVEPN